MKDHKLKLPWPHGCSENQDKMMLDYLERSERSNLLLTIRCFLRKFRKLLKERGEEGGREEVEGKNFFRNGGG